MSEALAFVDPGLNALIGGGDGKGLPLPKDRQMIDEGMATLRAYRALAPETLSFLNDFGPEYQNAANKNLDAQLFGSNGQPGSLNLLETKIAPTIARANAAGNRATREADVADVERLGGRATAAIRSANPQQAALLDMMNSMATEGLQAGSGLTPGLRREVQQSVRAGQSARGLGLGPNDAFQEAMTSGAAGQNLLRSRQDFAGRVAGMNQAAVGDPFMSIVGRPSMITPYSQNSLQQGQGAAMANAPQSDPFNQYAQDLYNTNFNAAYSNVFNQRNNDTAREAAMMQMIGSIVGGAGGAAGALCWVARAVYGDADLRWVDFREWLMEYASEKFRNWYKENGERYAARVAKNDTLRLTWYRFMEKKRQQLWKLRANWVLPGRGTEAASNVVAVDFGGDEKEAA